MEKLSRKREVKDEKQRALLLDARWRHLVLDFAEKPMSVKEAAQKRSATLEKAHYQVTKLVEAGLLNVVEVQARKGRAIKKYQAVAREFILAGILQKLPEREVVEQIFAAIDESTSTTVIGVDEEGRRYIQPDTDPTDAGAFRICTQLSLTKAEKTAFKAELKALISKYAGGPSRRSQSPGAHVVWVGLAKGELHGKK
ncbi:MAG: hypothetical protein AAFW68_09745 [Pseudomonadota bacterium]